MILGKNIYNLNIWCVRQSREFFCFIFSTVASIYKWKPDVMAFSMKEKREKMKVFRSKEQRPMKID